MNLQSARSVCLFGAALPFLWWEAGANHANPATPPAHMSDCLGYALIILQFVCAASVECLVFYAFLRRRMRSWFELLLWVIVASALTNPATQIVVVALVAGRPLVIGWLTLCAIEAIVVAAEWAAFVGIFGSMRRRGKLMGPLSKGRIFAIALSANVAGSLVAVITFVASVVLFSSRIF